MDINNINQKILFSDEIESLHLRYKFDYDNFYALTFFKELSSSIKQYYNFNKLNINIEIVGEFKNIKSGFNPKLNNKASLENLIIVFIYSDNNISYLKFANYIETIAIIYKYIILNSI